MPRPAPCRSLLTLFAVAFLPLQHVNAQASSPEQRAKFVQIVQALEKDPLGKDAKEQRSQAMLWLIQAPDVSVKVCGSLMAPLLGTKKNYAAEIFGQMTLASGVFVIQNPGEAKNRNAMYAAGVEGALRTYEAIVQARPGNRWPFLDGWIEKREQGTLHAEVAKQARACK